MVLEDELPFGIWPIFRGRLLLVIKGALWLTVFALRESNIAKFNGWKMKNIAFRGPGLFPVCFTVSFRELFGSFVSSQLQPPPKKNTHPSCRMNSRICVCRYERVLGAPYYWMCQEVRINGK